MSRRVWLQTRDSVAKAAGLDFEPMSTGRTPTGDTPGGEKRSKSGEVAAVAPPQVGPAISANKPVSNLDDGWDANNPSSHQEPTPQELVSAPPKVPSAASAISGRPSVGPSGVSSKGKFTLGNLVSAAQGNSSSASRPGSLRPTSDHLRQIGGVPQKPVARGTAALPNVPIERQALASTQRQTSVPSVTKDAPTPPASSKAAEADTNLTPPPPQVVVTALVTDPETPKGLGATPNVQPVPAAEPATRSMTPKGIGAVTPAADPGLAFAPAARSITPKGIGAVVITPSQPAVVAQPDAVVAAPIRPVDATQSEAAVASPIQPVLAVQTEAPAETTEGFGARPAQDVVTGETAAEAIPPVTTAAPIEITVDTTSITLSVASAELLPATAVVVTQLPKATAVLDDPEAWETPAPDAPAVPAAAAPVAKPPEPAAVTPAAATSAAEVAPKAPETATEERRTSDTPVQAHTDDSRTQSEKPVRKEKAQTSVDSNRPSSKRGAAARVKSAPAAADEPETGLSGEFFIGQTHEAPSTDHFQVNDDYVDERRLRSISPEAVARRAKFRILVLVVFLGLALLLAAAVAIKVLYKH